METIQTELNCYCCKSLYNAQDKFCGNCGYPLQGTPEEQKKFSIEYSLNKLDKDDAIQRVKEVRIVLLIISLFTIASGLIQYFQSEVMSIMIINFILGGIYAGLFFWASKKAFASILTGGLIYVSIILLNAFVDPTTIFHGIIFKIIFIGAFIKASYGSYKYKV